MGRPALLAFPEQNLVQAMGKPSGPLHLGGSVDASAATRCPGLDHRDGTVAHLFQPQLTSTSPGLSQSFHPHSQSTCMPHATDLKGNWV